MVRTATRELSLEEFLQLPETKPTQEYSDGKIIPKPMPQGKHSRIQGKLVSTIDALATDQEQPVALALPELRCSFAGYSIVPDVAVLLWERIPLDEEGDIANAIKTHPDWTIEILSPEQSQTKATKNILHCLENGCNLGWLIDPEERSVLIFPPGKQPKIFAKEEDLLPAPDFLPELQLRVGEIFGWLQVKPKQL